ncbi:putative ABC transporter permease, partial [Dysosmobacter sp.]|uniref:putative ABC transporter permease n=1 Tax=Dysosmobacter sp. TaxID=2591382 RepID=UPI003AB8E4E9
MHVYSAGQWVLLFFLYCFLGWVWESCYVSVCRRQWVNRGFLHGPLLPIYGSGAILILFVTLPAEENLWLVWLLGMIAATALEYVTGDVMERLFKVRYWDYSKKRFNLNGHICLSSSIAWGFFSILLVRFLHPPVGRLLTSVPAFLVDPAALALTAAFTVDVVRSTQAALDLREILTRLTEENEELRRIAKRVEVVSAFAEDDLRRFREKTEVEKLLLQERLESARTQRKRRRREALEESLRRRTSAKLKALRNIAQALEAYQARLESELTGEALERRRAEIAEALEKIRDREAAVRARTERTYRQAVRILRGNPTASSGGRLSEA